MKLLVILLVVFEGVWTILLRSVLGGGVPLFIILFGILMPNIVIANFLPYKKPLLLSLLGCFVVLYGAFSFIWWNVDSDARSVAVKLDSMAVSQPLTKERIGEVIRMTRWLRTRVTDIQIEESGQFFYYYYIITPSISHWYGSKVGWGHSDD